MKLLTLKNSDIKKLISSKLDGILEREGFLFKSASNQFISIKGDFTFIFNMVLTSWSDHSAIEVRLFISHKKVESVFEDIVGKSHKLTIGNTIQRISKSPDGRKIINGDMPILLTHDEDVDAAVETLERYFFEIANPYFERYSILESIDDIINNPPFDYCPAHVGGRFDERCMKGLIVARLAHNQQYDHLVSIYDEAIKETMDSESIENYRKVKEYLMYNRI